jgi:hypothetical protein
MRDIAAFFIEGGDTIRLYGRTMRVTDVEHIGSTVTIVGVHDGYPYEINFYPDETVTLIDTEYDDA